MPLIRNSYGKGRVRIMRVERETDRHEARELTVKALLTGDFATNYASDDNSTAIATDTVKNIVARGHVGADNEPFAAALANAICGATGVRLRETPFTADRLYRLVPDADGPLAERPAATDTACDDTTAFQEGVS